MTTKIKHRPVAPPAAPVHWRERTDLTLDDIEALVQANAFTEYDRLELINGTLVEMAAKGRRHEVVREELAFKWTKDCPVDLFVTAEPQFNLATRIYTQPDLLIRPRAIKTPDLKGPEALLVVEVADTSLPSDITTKAAIYSAHGVREYWVINANTLVTTVHLAVTPTGYNSVIDWRANQMLVPSLVPSLAVQLDLLDL
jgi:Uma2 family endonuclease